MKHNVIGTLVGIVIFVLVMVLLNKEVQSTRQLQRDAQQLQDKIAQGLSQDLDRIPKIESLLWEAYLEGCGRQKDGSLPPQTPWCSKTKTALLKPHNP